MDRDAKIIPSHKQAALPHYEGGRGCQPMVAVWVEADLILADRDFVIVSLDYAAMRPTVEACLICSAQHN